MSKLEISRAQRLDQRVISLFPAMSRAYAVRLVGDGKVRLNGKVVLKAGHKLMPGDSVIVDYDPAAEPDVPVIELETLYEDDDCVVINKPAGLLTHSKGALNPEATVASWLRGRINGLGGERGGIVHRLDRATSGVMVCAKNPAALAWLQKQFSNRRVKKSYAAVVSGRLRPAAALIDLPIMRNPKKPQTFRVSSNGKPSSTAYQVITENKDETLLELKPATGRTHQLRVHLRHLGHPIVGDILYDGKPADRLYLHAHQLELTLPNRQRRVFTVPIPDSFTERVNSDV